MAFPFMSLISGVNQMGEAQRVRSEGASSWDPTTGRYYNRGGQEAMSILGSFAAPHKILTDPHLSAKEKAVGFFNPVAIPALMRGRSQRLEAERVQALQNVQDALAMTPEYQRSAEVGQMQDVLGRGAEAVRGIGEDVVQIAGGMASRRRPGSQIQREQVRQYAQAAIDDIAETGGASSAALQGIVDARAQQTQALMNIAAEDAAHKRQAEQSYMNAMMNQAAAESKATAMESAGLQAGIAEAGKEYLGEMEQITPQQQFMLTQLGNVGAQQQVARQNNSAAWAQLAAASGQALANMNWGGGGQQPSTGIDTGELDRRLTMERVY